MATLNKLAYNIRNIANRGQGNSDDERLQISQVKFWIQYYRADGINQFTDNGKNIDPQLIQDLGVIPLVEVDKTDADCPDVQWGCTVKKVVLPKFVGFPLGRAVSFLGKIDKRTPFIKGDANTEHFKSQTRFGKLLSRGSIIGQNYYLELSKNDADLEFMNARGVFEDPTSVSSYAVKGCEPKCFDDGLDEYPLPLNLYVYVLTNILQKELGVSNQLTMN
jgi:hypothetical protein